MNEIAPIRCEPATTVIEKMGGLSAVATILEIAPHTVMRWRWPRARRGTGGAVPHWHVSKLLAAAKASGIDLQPTDFIAPALDGVSA